MTGGLFTDYDLGGFYDEAVGEDGLARTGQGPVVDWFDALSPDDLRYHAELRDDVLRSRGITFTVYGEAQGIERTWPMDLFPRIIAADEWADLRGEPGRGTRSAPALDATRLPSGTEEHKGSGQLPLPPSPGGRPPVRNIRSSLFARVSAV